jgi:hypothetical protein
MRSFIQLKNWYVGNHFIAVQEAKQSKNFGAIFSARFLRSLRFLRVVFTRFCAFFFGAKFSCFSNVLERNHPLEQARLRVRVDLVDEAADDDGQQLAGRSQVHHVQVGHVRLVLLAYIEVNVMINIFGQFSAKNGGFS